MSGLAGILRSNVTWEMADARALVGENFRSNYGEGLRGILRSIPAHPSANEIPVIKIDIIHELPPRGACRTSIPYRSGSGGVSWISPTIDFIDIEMR